MTKFKVGDVVYLKSDLDQKMTVKAVLGEAVMCVWFGENKTLHSQGLIAETLVLDTEIKKLKARILKTTQHCEEVEESNRELENKVRDLEKELRNAYQSGKHWENSYNSIESEHKEYRDWLMELGLLEKSPNKRFRTREEWKKIREQENGKDK
jgi:uncharacterized protein YodC (DUF2158 family)